ncbi:MAG: hypothetical protein HY710_16160 [Candidatus Latescibacteria bacterium]|nr:hypothetical protein [Candidatus Latescibacterota bacterium]
MPDKNRIPACFQITDTDLSEHVALASVKTMQTRIVQLVIGLFERGYLDEALTVTFDAHPALQFAERFRRLLKLETLVAVLTDGILPRIRRRITFTPDRASETHRYHVRGALDWGRTLRANFLVAASPLLSDFVVCRPIKDFKTPENLLTVLTLVRVIDDARGVLHHPAVGPALHDQERRKIQEIIWTCRQALRPTPFSSLIADAKGLLRGERAQTEENRLEGLARSRIERARRTHGGYQALLAWREQYGQLDLASFGPAFSAPFRPISPDRAYELLVLLELLVRLSHHGIVRQRGAVFGTGRVSGLPAFECRFRNGETWEMFVQTSHPIQEHRYLQQLAGVPDFIIRNPKTSRVLIGDAKQYMVSSYGAAFYKMMGYLYQFGGSSVCATVVGGVLFVPHRVDPASGWTVWTGTGAEPHRQALMTLVLPPDGIISYDTQQDVEAFIAFARRALAQVGE